MGFSRPEVFSFLRPNGGLDKWLKIDIFQAEIMTAIEQTLK